MRFLKSIIVFLLGVSFVSPLNVYAETEGSVSFGVQAILPENQVEGRATYFDIEVEPKQEQTLELLITNQADHEIKVAVSLDQAATNSNGVVVYDGSQENSAAELVNPIEEIAKLSDEIVKVPANSQETVTISLVAPDEAFEGQILAGVRFLLLKDEDAKEEYTAIQNMFAYVIALNITSTENDDLVEPELALVDVELDEINYRPGLQTTFVNNAPIFVSKLTYEGAVFEKGSDQAIYTREITTLSIAPNNQFNLPITFDEGELESGEYVYKAMISNEDHEWDFEKSFKVEKD